ISNSYLLIMANKKINKSLKIVCLGGGIGTSVLINGFKKYSPHITVITSMADDGGSSGRLRKAYNIMPVGDMVSCIAALINDENKELSSLLTYRFPGLSRENKAIDGHKLGDILPASDVRVHLSAITKDGRHIHGETALDVAKYSEPYGLKKIYITPKSPRVNKKVIENLLSADVIISGPGDLYTNQLPVLIIPEIKNILLKKKCKKIFVLNIANKPFETKDFALNDFIIPLTEHLGSFPFDTIIANNNTSIQIPPIYHDSDKLANAVVENI
ncbi:MAG: YvcK family protein, partial [Candidatus Staskawiczbacteria bacterium]|nr:YvcK family protein [Candidatus Staskawiczbacteria bacterium]